MWAQKINGHCHSKGVCILYHVIDYVWWSLRALPPQYLIQVGTPDSCGVKEINMGKINWSISFLLLPIQRTVRERRMWSTEKMANRIGWPEMTFYQLVLHGMFLYVNSKIHIYTTNTCECFLLSLIRLLGVVEINIHCSFSFTFLPVQRTVSPLRQLWREKDVIHWKGKSHWLPRKKCHRS